MQTLLTISIDAIALSFAAMMVIDLALAISKAWCRSANLISTNANNPSPLGICAATLAPIFEDIPVPQDIPNKTLEPIFVETPKPRMCTNSLFGAHLVDFSIRELKKQASVAKIKNYSVLTKAQLVEALAA